MGIHRGVTGLKKMRFREKAWRRSREPGTTDRLSVAGFPTALLTVFILGACQPTVKVEAPDEPITINLNVKLDADVRVRLEEQAQKDIDKNDDIF